MDNLYGRGERIIRDHEHGLSVLFLSRKYQLPEETIKMVLAAPPTTVSGTKKRAKEAFERVVSEYYGEVRTDAQNKFNRLLEGKDES